jgi:hypothetical protein
MSYTVVWRHRASVCCGRYIETTVLVMYLDASSVVARRQYVETADVYSHPLTTGLSATLWLVLGQLMSFVIFYWNPFLTLNLYPRGSYFIRTISQNYLYTLFCILAQNMLINEVCKSTFGNGTLCYSFVLSAVCDWHALYPEHHATNVCLSLFLRTHQEGI